MTDAAASLSALRRACGFNQDRWAAEVGVSRKTVQRWESGAALPAAEAEDSLIAVCRDREVFGAAGVVDEDALRKLLREARTATGTSSRSGPVPAPVPTPLGGLVGRASESEALDAALAVTRLVTITGPGGVGKTRLALDHLQHARRRHADGTAAVMLASTHEPGLVLAAIADALGVSQGAGRSLRDGVVAHLRDRELLVLLDNFEHLLDAAPVVADLLVSCPHLGVVATSRAPLRLAGEHEIALSPLPGPAAVELFAARARAVRPGFEVTAAVDEICARLDRLPLAIELAAARMRSLSIDEVRSRVGESIDVVSGGPRDADPRHHTLEATLDWSYQLLGDSEQLTLRALGVFAGEFDLRAAAAVCAVDDALDDVEALHAQSMVQRAEDAHGSARFALLETVRSYAWGLARDSGEAGVFSERHASHYTGAAHEKARRLNGRDPVGALGVFIRDGDQMRAALTWALDAGRSELVLRLCAALAPAWDARSAVGEARDWTGRALAATRHAGPDVVGLRATVLNWAAYFASLQADYARAERDADEALTVWRDAGNRAGEGYALLILGQVRAETGDLDAAERVLRASLAALAEAGDEWGAVRPLTALGELHRARGDLTRALEFHERALAACRALDDLHSLPNLECGLGQVKFALGDSAGAAELADHALEVSRRTGSRLGEATALELMALVAVETGDLLEGAGLVAAAQSLRAEAGTPIEARDRPAYEAALARIRAGIPDSGV